MAVSFQQLLFLSLFLLCHSLASSSPSAGRHQHRHRHHHGDDKHESGGKAVRDVRATTANPEVPQPLRGKVAGDMGRVKHSAQSKKKKVTPAEDGSLSKAAVSMTTQPSPSLLDVAEASGKQHHRSEHADVPQPPDSKIHKSGRRRQRPQDTQPKATSPTSTLSAAGKTATTSSPLSQHKEISDQQSPGENKQLDKATPRNVKGVSTKDAKDKHDKVKDGDVSVDEDLPKSSSEPGDEKLVNRPRWRHKILQNEEGDDDDESKAGHIDPLARDNSSRNRPKNNKQGLPEPEAESDPQPDHQPDAQSGPTSLADPAAKQRFQNRPPWEMVKHDAKDSNSGSFPNPASQQKKPKEGVHSVKEDKKKNKQNAQMKEKQKEIPAEPVEKVKAKSKRKKKKNKMSIKGCPGCTEAELKQAEARELHKQVLKAQLLDKLRLVPTFQKQPWPPKLPDQVFPDEAQRDEGVGEDRYYARPQQFLLFGRDLGPRHRLKKPGTGSYKFGVRGKVSGAVRSARLWVYKMRDANDVHGQTLVITELLMTKRRRLRERSLVARLDTHVQEGWVSFDVARLVRRWAKSEASASLQMLAIRCKTCHRTNYRAIFGVKSHFRPVLVIRESREQHRPRKERSACDPTSGCCKFDMTVSVEELGIHEIFRPLAIKADYCYGTCERPDAYHYNHTMIVQHMRFNSHFHNSTLRERMAPCCVPVVLREATIYYYLNAGLDSQVSLVPNLLVDRCGCA